MITDQSERAIVAHPSEAGHWYAKDGTPVYTVKAKDGSERPTTLRDARKLSLVPSVTGIIKCAHAPGLEVWKQQQVLLAALTLPRHKLESDSAYMARVMQDSKEQARKASEHGTEIHAAIQGYYEDREPDPEFREHVLGANGAIRETFGTPYWKAEVSFASPIGFGGKVDLRNDDAVVDFKTKEFCHDDKLSTWDEHAMQIAAYQYGLGMLGRRGAICYVSTTHPGLARVLEIQTVELLRGWDMFKGLLAYWQAKNKYWPGKQE